MAATVLRVKRRLEENPQDALVLMCKRIKTDKEEISPSLFVFRGTVENQETTHVKNLPKTDIKLQTIPNVDTIVEKMRKNRKEESTKSRYEIVNCSRGLKEENNDSDDILNLIDLQKTEDIDGTVQYAYDLYTSLKPDFDISMIDNFIGVETDLVFDSYRDPRNDQSDNEADDDDDSNDENNWRNDYPDSEPSSIDEEDMIRAMERVDLEDDLSSDAGEDKIYDDPPDIFNEDVKRYGEAYAKYKARVMSENPELSDSKNLVHCHRTKYDEEEGYKDDSDDGFYYGEEQDTDQFKEQYHSDSDHSDDSPD